MPDDELDLNSLSDPDLVSQMHDDLYDGLAEEIAEGTRILLGRGWDAQAVLNDALVEGMRIVGIDFRDGILFVPEVLLAANAMKAGMEILRPLLAETGATTIGKVVIGTVKGDIHDIGKNLVAMMLEGAGFEVINLGINTDADEFIAALEEHKPDILGMSALLTTTMPYMKVVIDSLKEQNIRDQYIVMVGGAPLNEEFGKAIGADAYCRDAAVAAETAEALVLARRLTSGEENMSRRGRLLVIACGALAREIRQMLQLNSLDWVDLECLPATLHNTPDLIPAAVEERIEGAGHYEKVFVGYADCGTGGQLDRMLEQRGVERLPGAHCYEFFATSQVFAAMHEEEPGTFYLTDFLVRQFDRLVWDGLGLDRWPQLRDDYFGNYRRLVYISQVASPELIAEAREAADRLGLDFEHRPGGYGELASTLVEVARRVPA